MVSDNLGHLDFGGSGYLQTAKNIRDRGHEVSWISGPKLANRLKQEAFDVSIREYLITVPQPDALSEQRIQKIAVLLNEIREEILDLNPDICLVDRNLGVVGWVINSIGIPFVCMGTPGGYWGRDENGVVPSNCPIHEYEVLSEKVRILCPWLKGKLNSWWQPSPYLNAVFVGRSFYENATIEEPAAYVDVSNSQPNFDLRENCGVCFGNTGDPNVMINFLNKLRRYEWFPFENVHIYIGGRPELRDVVCREFENATIHSWISYDEAFKTLRSVVCYGGIGTLWHCINHRIPALVLPGKAGDQYYNSKRFEQLGLGATCFYPFNDVALEEAFRHVVCGSHEKQFEAYRKRSNFTDDYNSFVERILGFC